MYVCVGVGLVCDYLCRLETRGTSANSSIIDTPPNFYRSLALLLGLKFGPKWEINHDFQKL